MDADTFHLTHGLIVWLCGSHRAPGFVSDGDGRVFAAALATVWASAGALTAKRRAALEAHCRRMAPRRRDGAPPGSYAWRALRTEAEERFAAGEPPAAVIDELRSRPFPAEARAPSLRTMRRWFSERRWLDAPEAAEDGAR